MVLDGWEGCSLLMTVGGMDVDTNDYMDVVGRATQDAKAERTWKYLQRVMSEGRPWLPYYLLLNGTSLSLLAPLIKPVIRLSETVPSFPLIRRFF